MCSAVRASSLSLCVPICQEHGGEVFTNWQPRSILTRNGRACGVESITGDHIEATQFVASGLNPQQTFLDLIPADIAPAHLRERAAGSNTTCSPLCSR